MIAEAIDEAIDQAEAIADPAERTQRLTDLVRIVRAVGSYNAWIKVTDSPDVPVRQVGTLMIM